MKKIVGRMAEPTPKFFRILRNAGLTLTAVGGVLATAPVALPAAIVAAGGYIALAGGIMCAVSQSAVYGDD